jgi:hypothetical protein
MEDSAHFRDVLRERGIERDWVDRTLRDPELTEDPGDGTQHFVRRTPEFGGRWLRVVVNVLVEPPRLVTAFFDRRLRRRHESEGGSQD